jgi:hypothetical protein
LAFSEVYRKQVELLIRILPFIAKEDCFALKGGTAAAIPSLAQLLQEAAGIRAKHG